MQLQSSNETPVEELISRYRAGDRLAGYQLLERFKPLIGKYVNLLLRGTFRRNDEDVRTFLKCCGRVSSEDDYTRIATMIKTHLRSLDKIEIEQICQVALLETAYRFMKIAFNYKYVLLHYIKSEIKAGIQLIFVDPANLVIDENYEPEETVIDDDWVAGVTAGLAFSDMTPRQREILKMCWAEGVPDIHVCAHLNLTRAELKREKATIIEILRYYYRNVR